MSEPAARIVDIDWISDEYECDTCGMDVAEGAIVRIDGDTAFELLPHAFCYNSDTWEQSAVLAKIIAHLGVHVMDADENNVDQDADPSDKVVAVIDIEDVWSDEGDLRHVSQGARVTVDGQVLIDIPQRPVDDDRTYITQTALLVKIAEHLGARFTDGSLPSNLRPWGDVA